MADCYQRINYTAKAVGAYQNAIRYTEKAVADRAKALKMKQDEEERKQRLKEEKRAAKAPADTARADKRRRRRGFTNPTPADTPAPPPEKLFASADDSVAEATVLAATLQLARLQHKNGDYKAAIRNYERYLEEARILFAIHPTICTPQNDTLAMNGIIGARSAQRWKQTPTLHTIRKEPILASRRADFSPALLGDDSDQLYFTSTRQQATGEDISGITGAKYADLFFAKKDENGRWQAPEAVEGEVNTEMDEGVCCFSPDGKTMYLTRCTTDPDYPRYAKVFTSARSDATWGKPTELKISRDTLSAFAHPAVSPDGEWLYFVSDMPGGHGGKDIWRIAIVGSSLGGAENMPAPINTPGDEMFPTFRPNGDLYFSSDGHPGMGGLDLFCAHEDSVTHQWRVTHLGYPMNSASDDFGMTFEGPHNRGYFSTNRGDARGWDHIMAFECPEVVQTVKGWVYERDGYELPQAQVHIIGNDGTNQRLTPRTDGSFTFEVQPRVSYLLLATCSGYLNHAERITPDTTSVSLEHVMQFPLASINAPVLVRNVFYEFDSAELTPGSTTALDSLVALLNENPNVTIELASHCDARGNDDYNQRLSQRRAESVVRYLIDHGIAADRLTPVGYGESRPKVIKKRIAEQYDFLAEGDTLTEAFITALPDDDKREAAHALNRRTEFRVLRTTYGLTLTPAPPSSDPDKKEEDAPAEAPDAKEP
ncbi:MAG: OmpA family protein [Bacteroidaceae bacterium]|nr:OmpA family protein [Bacteroidaceae bacterium]